MWQTLKSAFTIVVVTAAVSGLTYSFFADTETSVGNTFTAGDIDLKIDHAKQTYNDVDCKTCSVHIVSDTTNFVIEENDVPVVPFNAAAVVDDASDWVDESALGGGAIWIWGIPGVPADDDTTKYKFQKSFTWFGPVVDVELNLAITGDDDYLVELNGAQIAQDGGGDVWQQIHSHDGFEAEIQQGLNTITFEVDNVGAKAGLLYELVIDGNCGDDYFRNQCRLWEEKDLAEGDIFFNFDDVKPGDRGVNVISLHPNSNDAWACLATQNEEDLENVANEVELAIPDTTTGIGPTDGELSPFLKLFFWWDTDANGAYDVGEEALGTTDFGSLGTIALADMTTGDGPLTGGATSYLGLYWCAGELETPVAGNPFACDGEGMGNIAQTDKYVTDIVFSAIQSRNNEDFACVEENE